MAVKVSDGLNTNAAKLDARKDTVLFNKKNSRSDLTSRRDRPMPSNMGLDEGERHEREKVDITLYDNTMFFSHTGSALYAPASKNTTNFLTCLLCPKINLNEVAMTVDERVTLDEVNETY